MPVKPVCPNASGEQFLLVGVAFAGLVSGLSNPNPLLEFLFCLFVNKSMVEVFNSKYNLEVEFDYINCGVYMMRRELLESWMNGVYKISLEEQLIPCLIKSGIDIFGYSKIENLVDIGTPDRYESFKSFYAN